MGSKRGIGSLEHLTIAHVVEFDTVHLVRDLIINQKFLPLPRGTLIMCVAHRAIESQTRKDKPFKPFHYNSKAMAEQCHTALANQKLTGVAVGLYFTLNDTVGDKL